MGSTDNLNWSNIDKKVRGSIMLGLALGMLLATLDGTIVSTSLPKIVESLGGNELYSWVFTGFMLCETVMIPIAGKLSDLYGRKPLFLLGIIIFLAGSVLSGLCGSMMQLIIFRAIQGIGGGMLIPVATAAVADLYSPAERGKMQGMLGSLFAVAMCLGPFLGGYITDNIGWHWIFFINVPIGIIAIIFTMKKFPKQLPVDNIHVDYTGIALLSGFLLVFLLFFTWGGVDFAWISAESFVMVAVSLALLALFIWNEFKAKDPVLKPSLFKNKMFVYCSIVMIIFGMGMMGIMAYLPYFMQLVVGISATNSGLIILPMVIGIMITSMASGFTVKRTGYRPWLMTGPIVAAIGMILLSTLSRGSSESLALFYLFVTGLGLGCVMSVVMIAAQNSANKNEMGMTTSSVNLFRSIGSTVAVGIFTTIINSRIAQELLVLPDGIYDKVPHTIGILDQLLKEPIFPTYYYDVIDAYGNSVTFAFLVGAVIVLLVFAVAIFMKGKPPTEIEITESKNEETNEVPEALQPEMLR